jgi:hypothetical protein
MSGKMMKSPKIHSSLTRVMTILSSRPKSKELLKVKKLMSQILCTGGKGGHMSIAHYY